MAVHKRGDRWHYAFCIRGVRYRGALPEARNKVQAQKAETKIRQEVYDGRYGRPTGETSFEKFVQDVYKPWARDNKPSFENNEKYKMPMICESKSLKGKTFAQISPLLIEKYKKERRESELENGRTRKPSTINRELQILSRIFSLASGTELPIRTHARRFRFCRRITNVCGICWMKRNNDSYQS
jgi:hypothetical protein